MDKKEFLNILRESLQGNLSEAEVQKHILYYEQYISSGGGKGWSEKETIQEIGDPRLIARTILDVGSGSSEPVYTYQEKNGEEGGRKEGGYFQSLFRLKWYHKWIMALIGILLVLIVLSLVFSILRFVGFVAYYLLPILAIVLFVKLVVNLFHKK